jgi:hypothetical protein
MRTRNLFFSTMLIISVGFASWHCGGIVEIDDESDEREQSSVQKPQFTLDRIEGDWAVLLLGSEFNIPKVLLPNGCAEGDILNMVLSKQLSSTYRDLQFTFRGIEGDTGILYLGSKRYALPAVIFSRYLNDGDVISMSFTIDAVATKAAKERAKKLIEELKKKN